LKDAWDKAQSLATIVSLLAVPTVLAWGGWRIQERVAEQATKREYVQLAVSILRELPNKENKEAQSLRTWAIALVDKNAPQPLTAENRQALFAVSLPNGMGIGRYGSSDVDCGGAIIIAGEAGYSDCLRKQLHSRDVIIRDLLLRDIDGQIPSPK
jgi:hypothetical protein